ncbi:uncharacterized protein PAC_15209 [Phialocephala subalpina]|uniref:Calpain catalytic domain-containing protein n=1 Tax=Phialocephala subalpina TaxID=576137 RepID=A0A1L7XJU6_9HELO|nr:uncharacterized protein PAC_15209 [Phialocephala subalpina]
MLCQIFFATTWLVGITAAENAIIATEGSNPPIQNVPLYPASDNQPHEFDVNQILTPDCWLEATLAAVVRVDPSKITQMLHDNSDGTVTVSLFDPFNLSALIPPPKVNKKNFVQTLEYQNSHATWVQVIQDALNPLVNGTVFNGKGGYATLAFSAIYGETAIYSTCDQLLSLASKATVAPIVLSSKGDVSGPLVEGHTYTVENVAQVDGSSGVTMRNPWGIVNENIWGVETSKGVKNLGHGEFDISNDKAQVQCAGVAHLQNL